MRGIVVGVDESDGAAEALRWAVREGELRGWPVTAVMAWDWLDQRHLAAEDGFDPSYDEREALAVVERIVEDALGRDGAGAVAHRAIRDLAADALLDASADAELLVVGARGLGGFRGLLLGSVSRQCLHRSTRPVAVVRTPVEARAGSERIVVGVDGSATAQRALDWALAEARVRHATVEAVHAWRIPYVAHGLYGEVALDPTPYEDEARQVLRDAVAAADTEGLPAPVQRTLTGLGAARAIVRAAGSADLVVIGSRGLGGFKELLLGSVSQQVTHHAPCPVVVIPPSER